MAFTTTCRTCEQTVEPRVRKDLTEWWVHSHSQRPLCYSSTAPAPLHLCLADPKEPF
jgi:hypothetical protein